ncbi:hypothetical protein V1264_005813 [Littorina saxatilis]|uniref:DDE-1 domain-containing protein n=1 Tax=Littorina saxatilis TaxID=31220 RepID=A0AAN9G6A6_9CAEN
MTGKLFLEWLDKLNAQRKRRGRKILLFIDNCTAHHCHCTAHHSTKYSNITVQFLPPNTTSKLQPLDAGIIASMKAQYRKRLLRHILAGMDEVNSAEELAKTVTVLDAIRWLDLAWCSVTSSTISKCFGKCGFVDASQEEEDCALGLEQLLGDTSWQDPWMRTP